MLDIMNASQDQNVRQYEYWGGCGTSLELPVLPEDEEEEEEEEVWPSSLREEVLPSDIFLHPSSLVKGGLVVSVTAYRRPSRVRISAPPPRGASLQCGQRGGRSHCNSEQII